jgi:ATP-binding cassette subfamily F protein 3
VTLVRLSGVGKEYGARWIFRDVSFQVSAGERWGVVGRNGLGKTTLLRVLTGEEEPTEGEVWRHPGTRLGLLRQERGETGSATVKEAALEPLAELLEMERVLEREAERLTRVAPESDEGRRLLASYDHHLEQFRRRGGYEARARAEATLEGLGFPPATWGQAVRSLSGGELGRLRLAQTLLAAPDVLLLDEPTNHLDLRSVAWLEEYLRGYPGTVLAVSHDRAFLERLADHVLHLEEGTAYAYAGGYEAFLVQREERREVQRREAEKQREMVERTEEFIRRNLAGQKTKQAKSRRKLLERLERMDAPGEEGRAMALRFDGARRSGGTVLRLEGVTAGFGAPLFAPFRAEVSRGERVAVVGRNGCGNSTLMKVIAGVSAPLAGEVIRGAGVRAAYYRQDFSHLDPERSIRQEVSAAAPSLDMHGLRGHLARFLFTGDQIEARIGDLSGGERARVALAIATLEGANLLLLDEPTNHLDIVSCEMLEEALESFDGTVVLISHDRALLSAIATRVWAFPDAPGGPIEDYRGGFDEWRERAAARPAESVRAAEPPRAAPPTAPRPAGLSKNELRRRREELARLEERIERAEAEVADVEAALADPALYAGGGDAERIRSLGERRDRLTAEVAELYAAWERTGEEVAEAV